MKNFRELLSSFELRKQLNPKIWSGNPKDPKTCKLKPKVRKGLLKISEKFLEYLGEEVFVEDIVLTGSLSNFNWSQYSDFDLHLIINFEQFENESEIYKENFNLKKQIFNDKHNIKIYGFDVELYAQAEEESHFSSGVYSVLNDDWVSIPKEETFDLDKPLLKKKVKSWISKINYVINEVKNGGDLRKLEKLKEKLKEFRKSGLEKKGELSYENLTFKFLRRSGHIQTLFDTTNKLLDRELSIENKLNEQKSDVESFLNSKLEEFLNTNITVKKLKELADKNVKFEFTPSQKIPYSEDVATIQGIIDYLGFELPEHGIDGKFGEETEKAVKEFQKKNGLTENGVVGQDEYKKFVSQLFVSNFTDKDLKKSKPTKLEKKGSFTYVDLNTDDGYKIYKEISDQFINKRNPNSGIDGTMMADAAKKYFSKGYVPPELALAQLAAEGGISKDEKDKPRYTKNPFNVGNTTSGKVRYFNSFQEGIDAYYDLITRKYLVGGKSAEDLVNNFVNINGNRYADKGYESLVRDVVKNVSSISDKVLSEYSS
jgi:peptidoglycan hydrolase-like protein with peptidoglycan-binding domain